MSGVTKGSSGFAAANPPPLRVVAAALRKTTEHLAAEIRTPGVHAPPWSELEWTIARAAAAMQGISALLAGRLRWRGPGRWSDFLQEQRDQTLARERLADQILARIDASTRARGIGVVVLKGAALRRRSLYADGERPMGDIDLLTHPRDGHAVACALATLEYRESADCERHKVYITGALGTPAGIGESIDNSFPIEVHPAIFEPLPVTQVDITARILPAVLARGLNDYPSPAALMSHLLLHAAGNMRANALRFIQLQDLALLGRSLGAADWHELCGPAPWWALPPLLLAERYLGDFVPRDRRRALESACPWWLRSVVHRRTLTDLSWSNLRIAALPGVEWSRTPLEALRYARSRIRPSHAALDKLRDALVLQPHLERIPWYGLPHSARILRWLFTRPPRVQSWYSVLGALDAGPAGPEST